MDKSNVFHFVDYKAYLRDLIQRPGNRGLLTEAANAIECGKSFLSRVLNEKMDLSTDQGFRLSRFLGHAARETEYLLLCIDLSRAQSRAYKDHVRAKIQELKAQYEESQKSGRDPVIATTPSDLEYYASWYMIPLHLLTSTEGGITTGRLASRLAIPEEIVKSFAKFLIEKGYIVQKGGKLHYREGSQYLPAGHPMLASLQKTMRDQAMFDNQFKRKTSLHYSSWHAISEADFERIRTLLVNTVQKANEIADPSRTEMVAAVNIDFFDPFFQK